MNWPAVFVFVFLVTPVESGFHPPSVDTRLGTITGQRWSFSTRFLKKTTEVTYYLGIPYARPPIHERRFRHAEPSDPFEGAYNATEIPPSCIQDRKQYMDHLTSGPEVSEDCLYLNIFAPVTAPPNASVMIWIHGGLFERTTGSDFPYSPIYLAALGNVIVVTFNYRLNIFGFLTTGDDEIPPNIALTDQQLAMKWVNQNIAEEFKIPLWVEQLHGISARRRLPISEKKYITWFPVAGPTLVQGSTSCRRILHEAFGGDPSKVTIFGEYFGAVSVGWHLLSPSSREYFQRAVLQNGNPHDSSVEYISPELALERFQTLGDLAECNPPILEDTSFIADCLRLKSEDELLELQSQVELLYPNERLWDPVVDGELFPKNISDLLEDGDFKDIDILLGTARDEGTLLAYSLFNFPREKPFVSLNDFTALSSGTNDSVISTILGAIYSDSIDENCNYFDALADAIGDSRSTCPMIEFARLVKVAGSNIYMYQLTHVPFRSIWNVSMGEITHLEETQLVFGVPFRESRSLTPSYDDVKVSFYIIRMWTNFAKSGDPNFPNSLPRNIPKWPKFSSDSEQYKELDINFSNSGKLRKHYCDFWDNALPRLLRLREIAADDDRLEEWHG